MFWAELHGKRIGYVEPNFGAGKWSFVSRDDFYPIAGLVVVVLQVLFCDFFNSQNVVHKDVFVRDARDKVGALLGSISRETDWH